MCECFSKYEQLLVLDWKRESSVSSENDRVCP
ncbi:hypothetical protein NC651_010576 [Populus alba x Populus x berolinensis]|nr:hypothetical protein NC651_010576 [Populus alba x Populus x berolinensis]